MIRRSFALLAALATLGGTLAPALEALAAEADSGCHSGGAPCPDTDDGGAPCGAGCPCTCCPGHRPAPALPVAGALPDARPGGDQQPVSSDVFHPGDFLQRIFRPPRA